MSWFWRMYPPVFFNCKFEIHFDQEWHELHQFDMKVNEIECD